MRVNRWGDHKDGLNDIIGPVDIGRTDNLDVSVHIAVHLSHDGGNVLIYVRGKDGLDKEHVSIALDSFHHT